MLFKRNISPSFPSKQIEDAVKVFVKMPQRNSKKQDQKATILRRSPRFLRNHSIIQVEPTSVLRRSPRFLAKNRNESEDPKTPNLEKKTSMLPFLESNSCISTPKESLKASKPRKLLTRIGVKESNIGKEGCGKQNNKGSRRSKQLKDGGEGLSCLRRSSRLSGKEIVNSDIKPSNLNFDEFKKEDKDTSKKSLGNNVMRVTRNSTRKVCNGTGYDGRSLRPDDCDSANFLGNGDSSGQETVIVVIGLPVQSVSNTKKTGNSNLGNAQKLAKKCVRNRIGRFAEDSKAELLDKGASLSFERKDELGSDQATMGAGRGSRAPVKGQVERKARAVEKKQKCIGVKRKRNQVEDGCENNGWTKDQDSALQRAYFAANPTPCFWKKVARMVPGKSAQDCFNRIHADHLTPRQTQPRSRARLLNSSPLSFSASKLLDSIRPKNKRPGYTKRKSHLVQKTVRELLQKQCQVNRDQNADLFSLFEPKLSPSTNDLRQGVDCCTPKQEKPKLLRRCWELSSSAHRKQCSRFNNLNEASLASPPVLKPVKNKALHEKYIDQLHAREAKRKAASARAAKSTLRVLDRKKCRVQKSAVESAKNALLLDARDALNQFQHVQTQVNDLSSFPDVDDDVLYSDEDINEG